MNEQETMTAQEVFDRVAKHLLTQNAKSAVVDLDDEFIRCQYRSGDGKSCAVGCLISDEEYQDSMEGYSVSWIKIQLPARLHRHVALMGELQSVHDDLPVEDWPIYLRRLAERNGLSAAVLGEATP